MERSLYSNVVFEDIDYNDYPDFSDAHIVSADFDGEPMTEEELEVLNDNGELVYELLEAYLY